jgi:hypothetical protein
LPALLLELNLGNADDETREEIENIERQWSASDKTILKHSSDILVDHHTITPDQIFNIISKNDRQFVRMAQTCRVIAGLTVYISGGSATTTRFDLGGNIVVPSSAFFPSLPATLGITRIGRDRFQDTLDMFITISRHVQILCSGCFAGCQSLLSISFEIDSELTRIDHLHFVTVLLSNQSQFLIMFKFFVQDAFYFATHFHPFHLKLIPN